MGENYVYLTNIPRTHREHFKAVGKILGVELIMTEDAVSPRGRYLPDHLRLFAPKEDYSRIEMLYDKISEASRLLAADYENCLREKGYPVGSLRPDQLCYLGCEKDYWGNWR